MRQGIYASRNETNGKLCFYLQATPVKSKSKVQDLLKGIEPVEYYYKDRNEIVRCSRLDVLPRIAGVWNE